MDKHSGYSISAVSVYVFLWTFLLELPTLCSHLGFCLASVIVVSSGLSFLSFLYWSHARKCLLLPWSTFLFGWSILLVAFWKKVIGGKLLRIAFPDIHMIDSLAGYRILSGSNFSPGRLKAFCSPLWQMMFSKIAGAIGLVPHALSESCYSLIRTERLCPISLKLGESLQLPWIIEGNRSEFVWLSRLDHKSR